MPLILWFDDSLLNTYEEVWPVMEKYGFVGNISVITGYIGEIWPDDGFKDKPQMTIKQIKEMHKAGWDFQSHGVTHCNFSSISVNDVEYELTESKQWMQKYLGISPKCFVYPYGIIAHENLVQTHYPYERLGDPKMNLLWFGYSRKIPITRVKNSAIKVAKSSLIYANFLFHSIILDGESWEYTPKEFQTILKKIYKNEIEVVTFSEAIKRGAKLTKRKSIKRAIVGTRWRINEYLKLLVKRSLSIFMFI